MTTTREVGYSIYICSYFYQIYGMRHKLAPGLETCTLFMRNSYMAGSLRALAFSDIKFYFIYYKFTIITLSTMTLRY